MAGRTTADRWCQAAQEGLLLIMLAVAPWAFAGAEPQHHAALLGGVAVLTLLAAVRLLLSPGPAWRGSIFTTLLAALFLLTALQLVPLPPGVLRVASPKSLELYQDLLPAQPEMLASATLAAPQSDWHPVSLYPFATRSLLVDLLALFLVAAIVQTQTATPAALRRLAWVALVNGSALSVFALSQSLSARPSMVYWSIPTQGTVFGPFINRDHFPFYVCLCIGLAVGLLSGRRRPLLQDSRQLWVVASIGLMAAACFFSRSRAGMLAMAGSTIVVGVMAWRVRAGAAGRPAALAIAAGVALLIALWLGTVPVESRLATLVQRGQLWQGRFDMWRAVLPHLRDFPVLGSGGGTFEFVEPMYNERPRQGELFITQYAHNEYLEAAFEGGLPRLVLALALAIAPCWVARRRLRSPQAGVSRTAILGLLWGLLVVVLHSAFDFGIHMPAIALLAVVSAAQLSAAAAGNDSVGDDRPATRWLVAALAMPLGLLLLWEAATWTMAEQYRQAASALTRSPRLEDRTAALPYWDAAIRLRPRDAVLHQSAGQANVDLYRVEPTSDRLVGAARHLVAARDLCPVLAHPHARLGEISNLLGRSDSPVRYFERAARLLPAESEIWYGLGGAYLDAGRAEDAQRAWRRYLESGERLRPQVFDRAVAAWGVDGVREKLLPDKPDVWRAAAEHLFPSKEQRDHRRPFIEGALALLEREPPSAEVSYRRATIQRELKRDEAAASYRAALREAPGRVDWRFEFAEFLNQRRRFDEARTELQAVLARSPNHDGAKNLLAVVEREIQLRDQ